MSAFRAFSLLASTARGASGEWRSLNPIPLFPSSWMKRTNLTGEKWRRKWRPDL
jgi:hypothetical protein